MSKPANFIISTHLFVTIMAIKLFEERKNNMNCHGNNNKNSDNEKGNGHKGHKGHMSHMLMMALCCGAPVIILLLLPLIGQIGGSGVSKALLVIAPFLCPVMMLFMMPMMLKGNKSKGSNGNCHENNKQLLSGEKTQELK